ncbi:MAG: signal recognition particle protein [Candidatus Marinimicrobia bacterium]|nr:signal recognition particle protein [Candidatus Neomarinimicrobiota bacterium]
MLEQLQKGFIDIVRFVKGEGKLTESNVKEAVKRIRRILLEADVNYRVVKEFIGRTTEKALGEEVLRSLSPGEVFTKIVYDELVELLGRENKDLKTASIPPTVTMLVGLQGSGKTTFAAKLAKYFMDRSKKPVLVSTDVYRPAAQEQLMKLGKQIGVPVFTGGEDIYARAKDAIDFCRKHHRDVLIVDTAGRLHIDEDMMSELEELKKELKPHNILYVADGMTGQDAVNTAGAFNERLEIDGIVLTKMDSDARGGAALSIKYITGKSIVFIGTGEKIGDLEKFYPDRMAKRILGMGDVAGLVEKVQSVMDEEYSKRMQKKIQKGKITLDDYLEQLERLKKMGPIESIFEMIPGFSKFKMRNVSVDERELVKAKAIIQSMTKEERANPSVINGSRRKRIAKGSGTTPADVNRVLNRYWQLVKLTKSLKKLKFPSDFSDLGF